MCLPLVRALTRVSHRTITRARCPQLLGKWHAGFAHPSLVPARRGFESGLGFYGASIVHSQHCAHYGAGRCLFHPGCGRTDPSLECTVYDLHTASLGVAEEPGYRYWLDRAAAAASGSLSTDGSAASKGASGHADGDTHGAIHATDLYAQHFEAVVSSHVVRHGRSPMHHPLFVLLSWAAPHRPFEPSSYADLLHAADARPARWHADCAWQDAHFGEGACDSPACRCRQEAYEADSPWADVSTSHANGVLAHGTTHGPANSADDADAKDSDETLREDAADDGVGATIASKPAFIDDPHSGPAYRAFSARKYYDALTIGLDRAIGRTRDALVGHGLWNETLFIFVSDKYKTCTRCTRSRAHRARLLAHARSRCNPRRAPGHDCAAGCVAAFVFAFLCGEPDVKPCPHACNWQRWPTPPRRDELPYGWREELQFTGRHPHTRRRQRRGAPCVITRPD